MTPRTTDPDTTAPDTTGPATTAPDTTGPAGTTLAATSPEALLALLRTRLHPAALTWLDRALADATAPPRDHGPLPAWDARLAEAGRRCGPTHADAARVLLLRAARADAGTLARVYRQGTADERRAVLHALPALVPGPDALPLVEDALRTNDTRLLAAAVGPYAARHLDAHGWRHALLKCLFTGVPVDSAAGLARRAHGDSELARMLRDFAAERTAAGRPVPDDLHRLLSLTRAPASPHPSDDPHGKES
ncbi:EboA domain-containing protein [Streptomyces sp. NBC_00102]|uniref:EboA domain-containing protein n=1 Tax=Streptomyces sp. NBC_00102 TaxID=2975652 RepID=UPI00225B1C83|nr:EboA domain-containing protein [Streptomyces sp. NBC_00102]MCX5401937.1 EboA domain-containing protein [Streptomyces sp. NBC_00102]